MLYTVYESQPILHHADALLWHVIQKTEISKDGPTMQFNFISHVW